MIEMILKVKVTVKQLEALTRLALLLIALLT